METVQIKAQLQVGKATPPSPRHRGGGRVQGAPVAGLISENKLCHLEIQALYASSRRTTATNTILNPFLLPFHFLLPSVCRKRSEASWTGQESCVQTLLKEQIFNKPFQTLPYSRLTPVLGNICSLPYCSHAHLKEKKKK